MPYITAIRLLFFNQAFLGTVPGLTGNTGHSPNVVSIQGQRRRRWPYIEATLGECLLFAGMAEFDGIVGGIR